MQTSIDVEATIRTRLQDGTVEHWKLLFKVWLQTMSQLVFLNKVGVSLIKLQLVLLLMQTW
jgi:hypothetical protein